MKMRGAMITMIAKNRLISPTFDGERCPYLNKLDKGIAPDPLPRIPPFLPERSFSTRATFPVRAASSSSWSFPMVGNQAVPHGRAAPWATAAPSLHRTVSPPQTLPQSRAQQRFLQSLPDQQEQQQEGGGESPPPSFTGSFLGGVWKKGGGRERGRTRPIKNLPPTPLHTQPRPGGWGGGNRQPRPLWPDGTAGITTLAEGRTDGLTDGRKQGGAGGGRRRSPAVPGPLLRRRGWRAPSGCPGAAPPPPASAAPRSTAVPAAPPAPRPARCAGRAPRGASVRPQGSGGAGRAVRAEHGGLRVEQPRKRRAGSCGGR